MKAEAEMCEPYRRRGEPGLQHLQADRGGWTLAAMEVSGAQNGSSSFFMALCSLPIWHLLGGQGVCGRRGLIINMKTTHTHTHTPLQG